MDELPSTAVSNSQSSAREARQRDERRERVGDGSKIMTSVFYMDFKHAKECSLDGLQE